MTNTNTLRFAFAGFRHAHIFTLHKLVAAHPNCEILGACEEDAATRETLAASDEVNLSHTAFAEMIEDLRPDVVAVGDAYGRRGMIAEAALRAGCHLISDKPLCTSLQELDVLEELAVSGNRVIGCMLDLREAAPFQTLHRILREGAIGRVVTINFMGQHPLRLGRRSQWYFEPGMHGGTINDIGIHAFDLATWLTGSEWKETLAARSWNAKASDFPHFLDSAQVMGSLTDGTGILADFSYLAPDETGFSLPQYWRVTAHGTLGVAETNYQAPEVTVVANSDTEPRKVACVEPAHGRHLEDFLAEIGGKPEGLTTRSILASARNALEAQRLSEHGL